MSKPLAVGDAFRDFTRTDHSGAVINTAELRGRWLVVFFYPKDNTPACTAQSCAFRDLYDQFTDVGARVIAVSSDSDESHRAFAGKHRLPFPLISDADGSLRALLAVPKKWFVLPGRVTYVVDPQGVVRHIFTAWLRVQGHIDSALATIKAGPATK